MIAVEGLCIRQGNFTLNEVSFRVPAGQYAVLMGRTGCGKSSILETIVGLRRASSGRITLQGRDVTHLPPAARNAGYVPQDVALFRTMTVRENLGFALAVRGAARAEINGRVKELAGWLQLAPLLDRRAVGLSGGEAQRTALGRALAARPGVLLLDEPLTALDEETRERLITVLDDLRQQRTVTVLHVTHTLAEAKRLGDVVLKLEDGRIANQE